MFCQLRFCFDQVTVNSGGVVFFATFKENSILQIGGNESVAVLKFTSSSLVTQSERLGNELAKHMGVFCPQVCKFSAYLSVLKLCLMQTSLILEKVLHS